jgi:hypothetical protein
MKGPDVTPRKHRKPRPTSRLRQAVAALTLTAAAVGGAVALTDDTAAAPADTTWGAPDTTDDTTWGNPPADSGDDDGTAVTPQDTTWG